MLGAGLQPATDSGDFLQDCAKSNAPASDICCGEGFSLLGGIAAPGGVANKPAATALELDFNRFAGVDAVSAGSGVRAS